MDASREPVPEPRPLAGLGAGAEGTIVELRLGPRQRRAHESPLREGATVYVVEAPGGGWLHVRIGFREYSVPPGVAERVVVAVKQRPARIGGAPVRAAAAYALLRSRVDRGASRAAGRAAAWRVRVVQRDDGAVVLSELFDSEADAGRRLEELHRDAEALDPAAFRARHALA